MTNELKMYLSDKDYALEYSFSQKCFHIESLKDAICQNLSLLKHGGGTDYVMVGIFKSYEDAEKAASYSRKWVDKEKT